VSEGDLTVRVKLRKGDEMGDLAEALNSCLERLGQRISSINKSMDHLESAITDAEGIDIKSFKDHVLKIKESLNEFRV
jgi:methyl-accepting chemotaxis protein